MNKLYICNKNGGPLKVGDLVCEGNGGFFKVDKKEYRSERTGRVAVKYKMQKDGILFPFEVLASYIIEVKPKCS